MPESSGSFFVSYRAVLSISLASRGKKALSTSLWQDVPKGHHKIGGIGSHSELFGNGSKKIWVSGEGDTTVFSEKIYFMGKVSISSSCK